MARPDSRASIARRAGDLELADALAPPSERKATEAERCGARNASNGNQCRKRKGAGTNHPGYGYCATHGGNTKAGIKSAMREMGRDLVARYKSDHLRFGGDRNDPTIASLTPEAALLEEVRRSAALVRFLEERIAAWTLGAPSAATVDAVADSATLAANARRNVLPEDLHDRVDEILSALDSDDPDAVTYLPALTTSHPETGITGFTDAREWLILYRDERAHLARTAKMCIDAGVAQRLVTLAEDQGRVLSSAIRAVLNALSLSPDQQALVPRVVPPILRAVASSQPIPDISSLPRLGSSTPATP